MRHSNSYRRGVLAKKRPSLKAVAISAAAKGIHGRHPGWDRDTVLALARVRAGWALFIAPAYSKWANAKLKVRLWFGQTFGKSKRKED